MMTRKELESLGVIMNDEQWKNFQNQMSEIADEIWEEEHPMDE